MFLAFWGAEVAGIMGDENHTTHQDIFHKRYWTDCPL